MNQPQWGPYCPKTGQKHPDAWACGICGAARPRTTQTSSIRTQEVELIDLVSDLPPATIVFPHYDCTGGAEQYHQAAITYTKKQVIPSSFISATVLFYLLKQSKNKEGFFSLISCKSLGMYKYLSI